ncbi:MAG: ATP-binding cassette domain-containing protein [Planctomycetales bacterium]|nr:ATP-binding cassette domain-containing protein [Planctomycetales bacterium]MBN8625029.1 ATP-binding cassette domain-containing protein [Planctomycetota bacterium]
MNTPYDAEAPHAVEVRGLSYRFVARRTPTLHDVTFALPRGTFTVVAGLTGSGKSTLLRALAGLIPNHAAGEMAGVVQVIGHDTRTTSSAVLASTVGLVLQSPDDQICTTTVEAEIAFGLENLALPPTEIAGRVQAALVRFGLTDFRCSHPHELSGGLRQRLVLAAVSAMHPQVLVCDEPLSQLDSEAAREFLTELNRLRAAGVTIVIAEHRLDEVLPHADRLLVIDDGRLVADVATKDEAPVKSELTSLRFGDAAPASDDSPAAKLSAARVAVLSSIAYRYSDSSSDVWSNLDAEILRGECIALVGLNGSGKSTLLSLLAQAGSPTAGHIAMSTETNRPDAVLVPQQVDLTLFSRTVREELEFGPRQQRCDIATVRRRVDAAVDLFQLAGLLDEPPQALSRGQRVRTALAAAYTCRPTLLLLDEPTTGQDAPTVAALTSALRATVGTDDGPAAIVFSTHHTAVARRFADRIWTLADGRLTETSAAEFSARSTAVEVPR